MPYPAPAMALTGAQKLDSHQYTQRLSISSNQHGWVQLQTGAWHMQKLMLSMSYRLMFWFIDTKVEFNYMVFFNLLFFFT